MKRMIAVLVFGEWVIMDHRCFREHGPMNACLRCYIPDTDEEGDSPWGKVLIVAVGTK